MKIDRKELNELIKGESCEHIKKHMRYIYGLFKSCQETHNTIFANEITLEMIAFLFARHFYSDKSEMMIAAEKWELDLTIKEKNIMYRFGSIALLGDMQSRL